MANLFAKKSMDALMAEASETGEHTLKRSLGPFQLISAGHRRHHRRGHLRPDRAWARDYAGPAVMLSFVLAASAASSPDSATRSSPP